MKKILGLIIVLSFIIGAKAQDPELISGDKNSVSVRIGKHIVNLSPIEPPKEKDLPGVFSVGNCIMMNPYTFDEDGFPSTPTAGSTEVWVVEKTYTRTNTETIWNMALKKVTVQYAAGVSSPDNWKNVSSKAFIIKSCHILNYGNGAYVYIFDN